MRKRREDEDQYRPARSASADAAKWRRNRHPGSRTCAINTAATIASRSCASSAATASSRGLSCFGTRSDSESQRPKAPMWTTSHFATDATPRDACHSTVGESQRPSARARWSLSSASRARALHHDRCDAYDCAERPYSRDAAAWTHDVALAVDVDHFLLSYGVAANEAKDGRTDAFLYFSSSAWLTRDHCVTAVAKE